jgi:glycosyltransferase involved in cell wall biosynthesis
VITRADRISQRTATCMCLNPGLSQRATPFPPPEKTTRASSFVSLLSPARSWLHTPMACVDVVIPLYQKAPYIGRALASVFSQTFTDFAVTVVDDGSTDEGPAIVESDSRVRLIRQANAGPGAARNRGWREGSAPLVAFLDADDTWEPTFLARMVEALDRHPDSAAAVAGMYWKAAKEDRTPAFRAAGITEGPWRCPGTIDPPSLKAAVDFMHSSAVVVRRPAIERLGGFSEERCTYGEDSWLWLRLLRQYPVYRCLDPLVWYDCDAGSLGVGRRGAFPVPPVLRHSEHVLVERPPGHREMLSRYLSWYTLFVARRMVGQGAPREALRLLSFPLLVSEDRLAGWKLRLKAALKLVRG